MIPYRKGACNFRIGGVLSGAEKRARRNGHEKRAREEGVEKRARRNGQKEERTMFRPMRRWKQQLPHEDCEAVLREGLRGVLAVSGDDGYPYAVPMNYLYADGKLFFHCAREGHKLDALRRCDKASFNVIDNGVQVPGKRGLDFRSVTVFGRIRILEDREEILNRVRAFGLKYFDAAYIEDEITRTGNRVCCLELSVEHMTGKRVNES